MARKPKGLTKPIAKTAARMSRKAALTPTQLEKIDAYWRASNYLSACQLYLLDNPLLKKPLEPAQIKKKIVGHWGTVPGQNFIYTHLNRIINKYDLNMIYLSGPGHGGNAMVAQDWLDGSYTEVYPNITRDKEGMQKLFKRFSFPGGIPSHVAPETPGSIHEGGELGYSLAHAFGAVADNPNLIAACVVGDGEAETGPLATSWHGNKFVNPITDGAVLPILHLNGFKIANPTIFSRMSHEEVECFFLGCGWKPYFVEGSDPMTMHQQMASVLDAAIREIKRIQREARKSGEAKRPRWPMIVLRTPKGWTGPKEVDGLPVENCWRAHQVPISMGADTVALLGIAAYFCGGWVAPLIGKFLDRYGVQKGLVLESAGVAGVFLFAAWAASGIVNGSLRGWGGMAAAFASYILIFLTDHFNSVHVMLMRELSESPADVMENLSFGLSVDHVLAVTVSGLLGAVWKYVGPQYVFLLGAAVCTVHLGVALWLKRQRRAAV